MPHRQTEDTDSGHELLVAAKHNAEEFEGYL